MNLRNFFLIALILFSAYSDSFGQGIGEIVEGENWVEQYGLYPTRTIVFRYDLYSNEDTVKFRGKLDLLKAAKPFDEWEGNYFTDSPFELGRTSFQWSSNAGFVHFYVYSCFPELRYLNYGKVVNSLDSVQFIPEFATDSPRKEKSIKYVKVKWSDRHYLVEETSLSAFAEKAAGIHVEPENALPEDHQKWSNYWVRGDLEKESTGLPEFPANYKNLQRLPIETKILTVGRRTIEEKREVSDGFSTRFFENAAVYPVTIGAGKNKGVKAGMIFIIAETGEEVFITKIEQNNAAGFIFRETDQEKNDTCYDNNELRNEKPCPKIKPLQKIKTPTGKFWF